MTTLESRKITVLTATLNAEPFIGRLIGSLQAQTDHDFEWIVVDGCSTDRTRELVETAQHLRLRYLAAKDFGIYDALNRGVQAIEKGYYLVVGADDVLSPDAIRQYRATLADSEPDIVTTSIRQGGRIVTPRSGLGWLYGMPGVAGSHAVGMLLNVDLHRRFGLYSRKFPIAADQLFVKQALAGGASIVRRDFVAGEFSSDGTSGSDPIGVLTEVFRVQLLTEQFATLQYFLFVVRLCRFHIRSLLGFAHVTQANKCIHKP